jgi:RNA ligase
MYEWNPVFNFAINIKRKYETKFGAVEYKRYVIEEKEMSCLEYWISKLNDKMAAKKMQYLEVNQNNEYILIRYGKFNSAKDGQYEITANNLWNVDNGFFLECRSIVINLKDEEIVIAPFKKFRNLNECPENELSVVMEEIKHAKTVEITNKLDGSMQCVRWYKGDIYMTGSQAIEPDKSWRLADGIAMLIDRNKKMAKENENLTFIYEYIALKDAHVVKYEQSQEGLYLIGIRDVYTGRQYSYKEVAEFATKYNVQMTQIFNKTFEQVLEEIKVIKSYEMEGFVVNIDGHMIKVKGDDYVQIHRILSQISSINLIIQSVAEDRIDDLISKVPEAHRSRIRVVEKIVLDYIKRMEEETNKYFNVAPKDDKATFMIWTEKNVPKSHRGYVRNKYTGRENNYIKYGSDKCPAYRKLKEMGVSNYKSIFDNCEDEE